MKSSVKFIWTFLLLSLPIAVQAACNVYPNVSNGVTFATTITVPSTLPVGGLIASQSFGGSFPVINMTCSTSTQRIIYGKFTTLVPLPGLQGVYQTNVPGIGMRVMATNTHGHTSDVLLANGSYLMPPGAWYWNVRSLRAEFYKTGAVTTGTLSGGHVHDERWEGTRGRVQMLLNNSIRFVSPVATCDLAVGDVNRVIALPPVKVSAFNSAVETGTASFDLTANCQAGVNNVFFLFSGTPSSGNGALFANTGSSRGTALSLSHRNVAYIPANGSVADRTRQIQTNGGKAVLPMNASYRKTGATVTAGTLASTVTVSITYN